MNLKWLLLLPAAMFCFHLEAQFRAGIQGGMNLATLVEKNYTHDNVRNFYMVGFNAGPVADFRLGKHISLFSSLILESKGTKGSVDLDTIKADVGTRLLYLDIPLLVRGYLKTGNVQIFAEAGPYAGIGLTGKATYESRSTSSSRKIGWGTSTDDEFVRPDFGAIAGGGIEWNRFYFEGSLMVGLANIFAIRELEYNIQHRVFSVKVGYFFKNRK